MTEGGLEPHTFTVANCAYHNMITTEKNQSVIVCGESGSGKTEVNTCCLCTPIQPWQRKERSSHASSPSFHITP